MKGFSSALLNALVVVALAGVVGVLLLSAAVDRATALNAEALAVGNHFDDANASYAAAGKDALFDASYAFCGCGMNAPGSVAGDFAARLPAYLNNATSALNGSPFATNYSGLAIEPFSLAACNATFALHVNLTVSVNGSSASRRQAAPQPYSVTQSNDGAQFEFNVTDNRGSQAITVLCP